MGILRPDQMQVEAVHGDGPLAQPCMVTMQQTGKLRVVTLGGLTKVEAIAAQIASGILAGVLALDGEDESPDDDGAAEFNSYIASQSVDMAEAILVECASRRNKESEPTNGVT